MVSYSLKTDVTNDPIEGRGAIHSLNMLNKADYAFWLMQEYMICGSMLPLHTSSNRTTGTYKLPPTQTLIKFQPSGDLWISACTAAHVHNHQEHALAVVLHGREGMSEK
jgi:hypothetical protein